MILYVTSFAKDMYEATGKYLLKSFKDTKQSGIMLVCMEHMDIKKPQDSCIYYRLDKNPILIDWLENNKSYIPEYLGGTATEENNPVVFTSANRKASRWFRKVVSLYYAYKTYGERFKYIIWIDSDCLFKRQIPISKMNSVFTNYTACFYYLGSKRFRDDKGVESGFIGFSKKNNGYLIIDTIMNIYISQNYLKYIRWDDGYIFKVTIGLLSNHLKCIDLAFKSNIVDVINEHGTFFADYVTHKKGLHRLSKILV